jgi:hypothetical protein
VDVVRCRENVEISTSAGDVFSLTDLRGKRKSVRGRYRVGVLQKRGRSARRGIVRVLDLRL